MSDREWLSIPAEQYHAFDAISSGAMRCFAMDGPLYYYVGYVARTAKPKTSEAKELGSAFHKAMEDRSAFDESYLVLPSEIEDDEFCARVADALDVSGSGAKRPVCGDAINLKLPSHRLYLDLWRQFAADKELEIITPENLDRVRRMIDACYDNPAIEEYLGHGRAEVTCVHTDPETGLKLKALVDLLFPGDRGWLDFKTTCRGRIDDFWRDFRNRGYGYQFDHYELVTGITNKKVVAVSTGPDVYEAQIIDVPSEVLEQCRQQNEDTRRKLRQLHNDAIDCPCDSAGIPFVFHSDSWGSEIDAMELDMPREPMLRFDDE